MVKLNDKTIKLLFVSVFFVSYMKLDGIRMTTLSYEDPIPVYTVQENRYLLDKKLNFYRDDPYAVDEHKRDFFKIFITYFGAAADRGRNYLGIEPQEYSQTSANLPSGSSVQVPLGDIRGRTALIPLVYGSEPEGQSLPDVLMTAKKSLFQGYIDENGEVNEAKLIDQNEKLGYMSVNFKYRKKGIRLACDMKFTEDCGFRLATSVASIKQSHYNEIKYEGESSISDPSQDEVKKYFYDEIQNIMISLGRSFLSDSPRTSIEDIKASLFWRRIFELNINETDSPWDPLLLIPYIELSGSIAPGASMRGDYIFDSKFGNNQHASLGFISGMYFDFIDTIYIGGEVGFVHFFKHAFSDIPIPNSPYQQNLYPFVTNITVSPGSNWHFALKIGSDYFMDAFSVYAEYVMMEHKQDTIALVEQDPAFFPEVLAQKTAFKAKVFNIGLTYDLSPNITCGFVWQAPVTERGAYKTTTVMFTFSAVL